MTSSPKVAIVTGAGTGIGKAAALALLKDGYRVALAGRRREPLEQAIADGRARRRARAGRADRRERPGVGAALFARTRRPSAASTCCSTTPASARPASTSRS